MKSEMSKEGKPISRRPILDDFLAVTRNIFNFSFSPVSVGVGLGMVFK
jgi:hypothetical protein